MSVIDTLITDRTEQDVAEWERLRSLGLSGMTESELKNWMSGMKGSYTPSLDMNRVGQAVTYIAGRLNKRGYSVQVSPKTDWVIGDIPTSTQLQQYLSCVSSIRSVLALPPDTPNLPTDMDCMTVQEANDIERIILAVDGAITRLTEAYHYAGIFDCGGGV